VPYIAHICLCDYFQNLRKECANLTAPPRPFPPSPPSNSDSKSLGYTTIVPIMGLQEQHSSHYSSKAQASQSHPNATAESQEHESHDAALDDPARLNASIRISAFVDDSSGYYEVINYPRLRDAERRDRKKKTSPRDAIRAAMRNKLVYLLGRAYFVGRTIGPSYYRSITPYSPRKHHKIHLKNQFYPISSVRNARVVATVGVGAFTGEFVVKVTVAID
jgi:hypothetical protein